MVVCTDRIIMECSAKPKRHYNAKQNSSMRANRPRTNRKKSTSAKPKPPPDTQVPVIIPEPTYPSKPKTKEKKGAPKQQLVYRKHLYNKKQITEVMDPKTGASSFRTKASIKYVLDDFNEIEKVGGSLLNVSPLSSNEYHKTEWRELYPMEKHCNCRRSGCEQGYCRCYQGGNYCGEGCECSGCRNVAVKSRTEELRPRLFQEERESKSFELVRGRGDEELGGCRCDRRQDCGQMYCRCRKLGINCGRQCGCEGCKN